MKNIKFRTLQADEIVIRQQSNVKDGKVKLLLYIDSRAVISLLNETVGNLNWQSKFYEVNGQLIGEIGIYDDERGIWVWKGDTGSESNIEAQKGLISDVYKRVLSRWGVNELYTCPQIQVPEDKYGYSGYKVSEIKYNQNREIIHLVIVNPFGKEVYKMGDKKNTQDNIQLEKQTPSFDKRKDIIEFIKENARNEYRKEGANKKEIEKFVKFYTDKIDKNGWKGDFHFDTHFTKWMSRIK